MPFTLKLQDSFYPSCYDITEYSLPPFFPRICEVLSCYRKYNHYALKTKKSSKLKANYYERSSGFVFSSRSSLYFKNNVFSQKSSLNEFQDLCGMKLMKKLQSACICDLFAILAPYDSTYKKNTWQKLPLKNHWSKD